MPPGNSNKARSPGGSIIMLIGAGVFLAAWFHSHELWTLLLMVGFLTFVPFAYRVPLDQPPDAERMAEMPRWTLWLAGAGLALQLVAGAVRWLA